MLSFVPLKSADAAASYYEVEDYYAKDSPEAALATHWYGKGAALLGLEGYVDKDVFKELLEGKLTNGVQLGKVRDGEIDHRPGYDLTFSAPKSVSLLSEIGNDKRLYDAHNKAVNEALDYIEKNASQTRTTVNNVTSFEKSDNLLIAKFRHDTSRDLDPQLHTHAVIVNAIKRMDDEWRSLSSEELANHKMVTGMVYRSALAIEVQRLGYEIEITDARHGFFQLKGIDEEGLGTFSKRRAAIEEYLEQHGLFGAEESAEAAIKTRVNKVDVDRDELKEQWKEDAKDLGLSAIIDTAKDRENKGNIKDLLADIRSESYSATQYALRHLAERTSVFEKKDIIKVSLSHGLGNVSLTGVERSIEYLKAENKLITVGESLFSTKEAIEREQRTIANMERGKGQYDAITSPNTADEFLKNSFLFEDQKEAAKLVLTTRDRVVGIQGYAGVGKSTLVSKIKEFADNANYTMIGIAPSAVAADELAEKTGMKCYTIASFMNRKYKDLTGQSLSETDPNKPVLLMMDEAGMVSTKQMEAVLKRTHNENFKAALLGDIQQNPSVEAGSPFAQLMMNGMNYAEVKKIVRQQTIEEKIQSIETSDLSEEEKEISIREVIDLKGAIEDSIALDVNAAFGKLGSNVTEISDHNERMETIANKYLSLSPDERQRTALIVPTNKDRELVNGLIREHLREEGSISSEAKETNILKQKGLTYVEKEHVRNYSPGDIVHFNRAYKKLGVARGEYLKISKILPNGAEGAGKNSIILENSQGDSLVWNPGKFAGKSGRGFDVYEKKERTLAKGDFIRWTNNDEKAGKLNSRTGTVTSIDDHSATVEMESGKKATIDLKDYRSSHWDHAWASTIYASQGRTVDNVIAHLDGKNRFLTSLASFYVAISRAKNNAWLYVDDVSKTIDAVKDNLGQNVNALDYLDAYKQVKSFEAGIQAIASRLEGNIVEAPDHFVRLQKVADHYANLTPTERKETLLVIPDHKDRVIVNRLIQLQLKEEGKRHGYEITTDVLHNRPLKSWVADHYRVKDHVRFDQPIPELNIRPGDYREVTGIDRKQGIVTLKDQDNNTIDWKPGDKIENNRVNVKVFFNAQRQVTTGELIRFTESNEKLGVTKNQTARVIQVTGSDMTLDVGQEKSVWLSLKNPNHKHWELAYSRDIYIDEDTKPTSAIGVWNGSVEHNVQYKALLNQMGKAESLTLYTHNEEHTVDLINKHAKSEIQTATQSHHDAALTLKNNVLERVGANDIFEHNPDTLNNQISQRYERIQQIAEGNSASIPTVIIASDKAARTEVAQIVRDAKTEKGELTGDEIGYGNLVDKQLSAHQMQHVSYFKQGDVLRFNESSAQIGIEKGAEHHISAIDRKNNSLTLSGNNGYIKINLDRHILNNTKAYQQEYRPLKMGDQLTFNEGIHANKSGTITDIGDRLFKIQFKGDDHSTTITPTRDRHFEYDFLNHSANGGEKQHALVYWKGDVKHEDAVALYRQLPRKESITVYTDSKDGFRSALDDSANQKLLTALKQYETASLETKSAWRIHFKEQGQQQPLDLNAENTKAISRIKQLEKAQEELAHQITRSEPYSPFSASAFSIDTQKLEKQANKHSSDLHVSAYLNEDRPVHRQRLAYRICEQLKDHGRSLNEKEVDFKELFKESNLHKERLLKISLTPDQLANKRLVDKYYAHSRETGTQWKKLFEAEKQGTPVDKAQYESAYHASKVRNMMAHTIYQKKSQCKPYLHKTEKSEAILEKHTVSHRTLLEKQLARQQAVAQRNWKKTATIEQAVVATPKIAAKAIEIPYKRPYWDKDKVMKEAMRDPRRIIESVIGESYNNALSRSGKIAAWGKKGSIRLDLSGSKEGRVRDFERGIAGDLIHYVKEMTSCDYYEALEHVALVSGLNPERDANTKLIISPEEQERRQAQKDQEAKDDAAKRERQAQKAQGVWNKSVPITGTLAEQYLKSTRGIDANFEKSDFRFNPRAPDFVTDENGKFLKSVTRPAFVIGARDRHDNITAVQMVYLDPQTAKKHPEAQVAKRTMGNVWGNAAKIHTGVSDEVIVAEGPETGASLIEARPNANIYISLGNNRNFGNLGFLAEKHSTDEILFAQDNDDGNAKSKSAQGIEAAAEQLKAEGITVKGSKPTLLVGEMTTDFNDVRQHKGVEGVKQTLDNSVILAAPDKIHEIPEQFSYDAYPELSAEMSSGLSPDIEFANDHGIPMDLSVQKDNSIEI